ncbi:hypothetical protein V5R04_07090 [Jonesiaceae bacterium BS-20]|uniref:Uncharacterized protein n=1 Tax=Jonesiaceae bacterium BS-20 TaxID=3120821 RepID=A0AAU7DY77_9MICO
MNSLIEKLHRTNNFADMGIGFDSAYDLDNFDGFGSPFNTDEAEELAELLSTSIVHMSVRHEVNRKGWAEPHELDQPCGPYGATNGEGTGFVINLAVRIPSNNPAFTQFMAAHDEARPAVMSAERRRKELDAQIAALQEQRDNL